MAQQQFENRDTFRIAYREKWIRSSNGYPISIYMIKSIYKYNLFGASRNINCPYVVISGHPVSDNIMSHTTVLTCFQFRPVFCSPELESMLASCCMWSSRRKQQPKWMERETREHGDPQQTAHHIFLDLFCRWSAYFSSFTEIIISVVCFFCCCLPFSSFECIGLELVNGMSRCLSHYSSHCVFVVFCQSKLEKNKIGENKMNVIADICNQLWREVYRLCVILTWCVHVQPQSEMLQGLLHGDRTATNKPNVH